MSLDHRLKQSLDQHFKELSRQIEWTNLAVKFQTYIDLLTFTLEEQTRVANSTYEQKKLWAVQALIPGNFYGLPFWLEQYDKMMQGEGHLKQEKPLMQLYMETRWKDEEACNDGYWNDIEVLWLLTQVTQIRGHLAILNAEHIVGDDMTIPDINARALMEERKLSQEKLSGSITCPSFKVENTLNLHKCEEGNLGFGLIPSNSPIKLQCQPGYYGTAKYISCPTKEAPQTAKCEACNCDPTGSESELCDDITGKCTCKAGFYGDKCETPNCQGKWDSWSTCACGSGQTHSRSWLFDHAANANVHCEEVKEEKACFSGCCQGEFACGGQSCIDGQKECDYA